MAVAIKKDVTRHGHWWPGGVTSVGAAEATILSQPPCHVKSAGYGLQKLRVRPGSGLPSPGPFKFGFDASLRGPERFVYQKGL